MLTEDTTFRIVKGLSGLLAAAALTVAVSAQAAPVSGQGTWETTLKARDINGNPVALNDAAAVFFYDTVLNLTWLANWNATGTTNWATATAWAAGLNINGFTGWSLPGVLDIGNDGCNLSFGGTDCGYNPYSGEVQRRNSPLAHMFYDTLGNLAQYDTAGALRGGSAGVDWGLVNTGPFTNMQSWVYWSVESAQSTLNAWSFSSGDGRQYVDGKLNVRHAVAVRASDVFAGSVPEPGSLATILAGLGALGLAGRRRRTR